MKKLFLLLLALPLANKGMAQIGLTLTAGPKWQDASVYHDMRPGYEYYAETNYANHPTLGAMAWSTSSGNTFRRSFMWFDLSEIPHGAVISAATLYLYSDPTVSSSSAYNGNSQLSGSNAFYLEKVTSPWHYSTLTWNNQPATTTSGRLWIGPSVSPTANVSINVKSLVQDWVNNPLDNYGLRMALENEVKYRSRHYASTNHANTGIRPKLVITYTAPSAGFAHGCTTPDISEEEAMNLPWYGNETYLQNYYDSLNNALGGGLPLRTSNSQIENAWLRIPIKFWVYQIDSSTPGGIDALPTEQGFQRWLDFLNQVMRENGMPLSFYMKEPTFVNKSSAVNVEGLSEKSSLTNSYRDNSAVNVHVVDLLDDNGGGESNPLYNAIFITRDQASSIIRSTTFAHEMGHHFFLMHTFQFSETLCFREPVDRGFMWSACPNSLIVSRFGITKRCLYTGDFLSDTHADPGMDAHGSYDNTNCTWDAQGTKDYRDDLYHPNPTNLMAYGNDGQNNRPCNASLSPQQTYLMTLGAFAKKSSAWNPVGDNLFDEFEPDNAAVAGRLMPMGVYQERTFHNSGRKDMVDWLAFTHPGGNGSLGNYKLEVVNTTASAVGSVQFYEIEENATMEGDPIAGITSVSSGNTTTYTIPCASLNPGTRYVMRVNRNSQSGTPKYKVKFWEDFPIENFSINGPGSVCSSNTTFSLSAPLPAGYSITWTRSSNITYVSGQGTANYVVKSNGNGSAWVEATLIGPCGNRVLPRKNVMTGLSQVTGSLSNGDYVAYTIGDNVIFNEVCNLEQIRTAFTYTNTTGVSWQRLMASPTNTTWSVSNNNLGFYFFEVNQTAVFRLSTNNNCGTRTYDFYFKSVSCQSNDPCGVYVASPNPSSTSVSIIAPLIPAPCLTSSGSEEVKKGDVADIKEIVLINPRGEQVYLEGLTKMQDKIELDVSRLQKGLYILKIVDDSHTETHRILVTE